MGGESSQLKNAKYKNKVKQFIDLFQKKESLHSLSLTEGPKPINQKQWIQKNLESGVKLKATGFGKLPQQYTDGLSGFQKYYQQFVQKNSLKFTKLLDARCLNSIFEVITFTCLLNNKYNVFGQIWFTIKTGQIYQIDLKQQYKGPSGFDVIHKAQFQKWKEWDTPQNRYKYAYKETKQYYPENSSNANDYGKKTDWNAHYNAQVQQSNAQFRQNMNKQAQEWNNYAIQKSNRGW